jgi:hypothetical protein
MSLKSHGVELRRIDSTGVYDYQWSEFAVMRGIDGLLYVGSDSGCSCNSFGDHGDLQDFRPAENWHDVVKAVRQWRDELGDYSSSEKRGAEELIERLSKSRPKKRDPKEFASLSDDWW